MEDFAVTCPLVPSVPHLISGSCSSPRHFGLGFLQTPPHDNALALLLAFGSAIPGHRTFTYEVSATLKVFAYRELRLLTCPIRAAASRVLVDARMCENFLFGTYNFYLVPLSFFRDFNEAPGAELSPQIYMVAIPSLWTSASSLSSILSSNRRVTAAAQCFRCSSPTRHNDMV